MNKKHTIVRVLALIIILSLILPQQLTPINIASANSIIEVSTFEELKEACNSNATITLLNDIICTEPITFEANRTIIIYGNGYTLQVETPYLNEDGSLATTPSKYTLFDLQTTFNTLKLYNLTMKGGSTYAINATYSCSKLYYDEVLITQSNSPVYCSGTTYMTNSVITNNYGDFGGGYYNKGTMYINNCTFSNKDRKSVV